MKRKRFLLLSLLSAVLFTIPYCSWGTGLFLFVAFVPLLLIEDEISEKKANDTAYRGSLTWWTVLAFGLWVLLTTYWVYFATWVGIAASLLVNTTYMALTFWLFHYTKRKLGRKLGYASFIIFWLCFEFLYIRAQYNFPWLLLGNGFANDVILIQWYELTGTLGGSLWVLLVNLAVFRLVKLWMKKPSFQDVRGRVSWVVALFIFPAIFSIIRYLSYEEDGEACEIVVIQPNIDPWMKFNDMPQDEQTARLFKLADSLAGPETDYIVGPETFFNRNIWHKGIERHPDIRKVKRFLASYPEAKMIIGATTLKLYKEPSEYTSSSRPFREGAYYYDSFNSAMQLDTSGTIPLYHKSMLVPGVEHMPHKNLLGFLEKLTIRLGGAFRSQGTQEHREAFPSPQDSTLVGPVICWESVFGEFVTGYVRDAGAQFLFIITNDGWWKKTAGHRQHNSYARLRAIENRRSVARSANTGISSMIDQRGREIARVGWWEASGIKASLHKNDHVTFYTRHGDYLGRMAVFITVILLLYAVLNKFIIKEK